MKREKEHKTWAQLTKAEKEYLLRSYPLLEILKDEKEMIRTVYFCFKNLEDGFRLLKEADVKNEDYLLLGLEVGEFREFVQRTRKLYQDGIEQSLNWLRKKFREGGKR